MEHPIRNIFLLIMGQLFLIFLVLKLTGLSDWSWFWVMSPVLLVVQIQIAFLIRNMMIYQNTYFDWDW